MSSGAEEFPSPAIALPVARPIAATLRAIVGVGAAYNVGMLWATKRLASRPAAR